MAYPSLIEHITATADEALPRAHMGCCCMYATCCSIESDNMPCRALSGALPITDCASMVSRFGSPDEHMFPGRGARGRFAGRFDSPRPPFGGLGPNGMRAGHGYEGPSNFEGPGDSPAGKGFTPRQPAIDPAVLERRKKSVAARLKRQVAGLQLSADLVDESVLERFSEIEAAAEGEESSPEDQPGDLSRMYMFKVLGGDDKDRLPICQQRFDQTQAFEYCLQLYQTVPEVRMSKYGHFIVPASTASS